MDSTLMEKAHAKIALAATQPMQNVERTAAAIELAALMLTQAQATQTLFEKTLQAQISRMMNDSMGKAFTTAMTDQCFRSNNPKRVANQLVYLMYEYGVPRYLSFTKRVQLLAFKHIGELFSCILVPLTKRMLRQETSTVILPGEPEALIKHMQRRRKEGVRINLNHLGEAILGEKEAEHRLATYMDDLTNPEIEYISIKISTMYSQLNLLAWDKTLSQLALRLKNLYRCAKTHYFTHPDGTKVPKFINLDMEEYRDLDLTVELFQNVLNDPEFLHDSAGIVLQSYLPDSFPIQQRLTDWAKKRLEKSGAPIKIRIVKGANLAMERVEASLRDWPQAPYDKKADVDANYKRMVHYGCQPENAKAVHIGIASHNLFDIAYALLLRAENHVEEFISFEMLEGMADQMRRVVQQLSGGMLLYCPAATKEEFQNAVAYLVRRLDENTAPENFLRHAFEMHPGTKTWEQQAELFKTSAQKMDHVRSAPRKQQNRNIPPLKPALNTPFENDADTDWSLAQNREWAMNSLHSWKDRTFDPIPSVIGGKQIFDKKSAAIGEDPSFPGKPLYHYALATSEQVDQALDIAVNAQKAWAELPLARRSELLAEVAHQLRLQRGNLIGAMIADTGKTIAEGDVEVSEAIDFVEYYWRNRKEISNLSDLKWYPKGTILVAPPWNFPCSIATGGIAAALAAGNCVIFKPASEAVLAGWELVKLFWKAGISQEVLQFITCEDDPIGSQLVKDPRIASVVLTGATETAKLLLRMRPGLDLMAETGGKNALIITNLSDRDLAVKDAVASAFGHAGQKCSACSLLICEAEVYDDPNFRNQLRDAAASLSVGSPWDLSSKVNPLIHQPNPTLLKGLTYLESGEEWLLKPEQDSKNPNLWSPGIKIGVRSDSFTYTNELFGPVLAMMRADNLQHALKLANGTPYGLTSGIHSLDDREKTYWTKHIEAGNCYINRTITGAIVERQPFGGCKASSFGPGIKAGGPNYLMQLMHPQTISLPKETSELDKDSHLAKKLNLLTHHLKHQKSSEEELKIWHRSIGNYLFYWERYFTISHDPCHLIGQDNFLNYVPHKKVRFRIQAEDTILDVLRVMAAAFICGNNLEVSLDRKQLVSMLSSTDWKQFHHLKLIEESEKQFLVRLQKHAIKQIRLISNPSQELHDGLADLGCVSVARPVLANGRVELLHYVREQCISADYHRYGNLGLRESEVRKQIPDPTSLS